MLFVTLHCAKLSGNCSSWHVAAWSRARFLWHMQKPPLPPLGFPSNPSPSPFAFALSANVSCYFWNRLLFSSSFTPLKTALIPYACEVLQNPPQSHFIFCGYSATLHVNFYWFCLMRFPFFVFFCFVFIFICFDSLPRRTQCVVLLYPIFIALELRIYFLFLFFSTLPKSVESWAIVLTPCCCYSFLWLLLSFWLRFCCYFSHICWQNNWEIAWVGRS